MTSPQRETEPAPGGWKTVWKISADCLRAAAAFWLAWLFWKTEASQGLTISTFFAVIFALAGVKHAGSALIELVRWILRSRRWARFQAKGAAPKADRLAAEADLKARGLIR